jgi:predicted Fe-Mo cluster-binding NifX family protein
MKICIPIDNRGGTAKITAWHESNEYMFIESENGVTHFINQDQLLPGSREVLSLSVLEEMEVDTIICTSIMPLAHRVLSEYNISVYFTSNRTIETAYTMLQDGKLTRRPITNPVSDGCHGTCGSCESESCK